MQANETFTSQAYFFLFSPQGLTLEWVEYVLQAVPRIKTLKTKHILPIASPNHLLALALLISFLDGEQLHMSYESNRITYLILGFQNYIFLNVCTFVCVQNVCHSTCGEAQMTSEEVSCR